MGCVASIYSPNHGRWSIWYDGFGIFEVTTSGHATAYTCHCGKVVARLNGAEVMRMLDWCESEGFRYTSEDIEYLSEPVNYVVETIHCSGDLTRWGCVTKAEAIEMARAEKQDFLNGFEDTVVVGDIVRDGYYEVDGGRYVIAICDVRGEGFYRGDFWQD